MSESNTQEKYPVGVFDVTGLIIHDDGDPHLKFDIPLDSQQQGALAELIAQPKVSVHVAIYLTAVEQPTEHT